MNRRIFAIAVWIFATGNRY